MGLSLNKRQVHIGATMRTSTQTDEQEKTSTVQINVSGVMLDKGEPNELLGDQYASAALFNTRGKIEEPMFRQFRALPMRDKFDKCIARFYVGLNNEVVELKGCKFSKIHIEPTTGGLTEVSMQVSGSPDSAQMARLFEAQDSVQSASFRFGSAEKRKKDQPELPLQDRAGGGDEHRPSVQ